MELLNCVISLLNSSIIDVDRLDYIIRDSATIGFKNAQVDYVRLLAGLRIVEYEVQSENNKDGSYKTSRKKLCIGYHKSALSVIESAIYAHDTEKSGYRDILLFFMRWQYFKTRWKNLPIFLALKWITILFFVTNL